MRSEVPVFTQENFEGEFWVQKKYIEYYKQEADGNHKPTFRAKYAVEMAQFYADMLAYYGLPEVAPYVPVDIWALLGFA